MSSQLTPRQAFLVLNGLPGIGPVSLRRLLNHFQEDATAILNAAPRQLKQVEGVGNKMAGAITCWQDHFDLKREESLLKKYGASLLTLHDANYPPLLKEIYDPPVALYVLGTYPKTQQSCVGIVGTRRATLYGKGVAKRLGRDLARIGFCVVSGMARGVDTQAHEGVLEAEGKTVAVLGCGLDIVYPPDNLDLYRKIAAHGAILSEFPFGRRPDRQTFPMRNRIMAGLCQAIAVVESGRAGGSMITARFAAENGRQVFAVPGRIDQASSQGCHQLLREGATLLTSAGDVLQDLGFAGQMVLDPALKGPAEEQGSAALPEALTATEQQLAACFADGATHHPDTLATLTQLPLPEVSATLLMLELKHILAKRPDGSFEQRYKEATSAPLPRRPAQLAPSQ